MILLKLFLIGATKVGVDTSDSSVTATYELPTDKTKQLREVAFSAVRGLIRARVQQRCGDAVICLSNDVCNS